MGYGDIEKIIERYARERRHESREVAQVHFLSYVRLVCSDGEVEPFLKRVRGMASYYIASLSLFDNPFRNTQCFWLILITVWFCFNFFLITHQEYYQLGIINCAGAAIFGSTLWKIVWSKWIDTSLLIDYYREILEFIDSRQNPQSGEPSAS